MHAARISDIDQRGLVDQLARTPALEDSGLDLDRGAVAVARGQHDLAPDDARLVAHAHHVVEEGVARARLHVDDERRADRDGAVDADQDGGSEVHRLDQPLRAQREDGDRREVVELGIAVAREFQLTLRVQQILVLGPQLLLVGL